MTTITKVSREVSKTVFLETFVRSKRGSINAKASYEAEVSSEPEARAMSIALNAMADKDVSDYLASEIAKLKASE